MFELGFLLIFLGLAAIGFKAGKEIRSITGFGVTPFSWPTFPPSVQDTVLPRFRLPGQGSPGSECGTATTFICLNKKCGKLFSIPAECGERQCPHCSYLWVRREARIMKGRCWDGRDYYRKRGERPLRLHHLVVSYSIGMPDDGNTYRDLRRHAYQLSLKAGLGGGCIVFHPWRESRDKSTFDVVGPHFHIFGLGNWIRPSTEVVPYDLDVVFKRVKHFDARQIDPWEYVLTHCGIMEGTHAVVWFGCLAYNKMPRGDLESAAYEKSTRTPLCPYCGSESSHVSEPRNYKHGFWEEPKVM